jgi:hypothetical protein
MREPVDERGGELLVSSDELRPLENARSVVMNTLRRPYRPSIGSEEQLAAGAVEGTRLTPSNMTTAAARSAPAPSTARSSSSDGN